VEWVGPSGERVRYWTHPAIPGADLMRARFRGHEFGRHSHDRFALGVVEYGTENLGCRRGAVLAGPGSLVLLEPGEVHAGRGERAVPWGYRVVYLPAPVAGRLAGAPAGGVVGFPERVVVDGELAAALLGAHRAAQRADALEASVRMEGALARVLRRYGSPGRAGRPGPARPVAGRRAVERAVEVLAERMVAPPSLGELAAEVEVGRFALVRAFNAVYGLPPYAVLAQLRVRRAARLLAAGVPPAAAAAVTGFTDQAHLSRHFHRVVGLPPGAFRRAHGWPQRRTSQPGGRRLRSGG
jgi:AraC-like DNA-binding protein